LHNFINQQHPALILKVWPLIIGVGFFYRTYTSCYVNSDEEGTDSVAGKMVQDIKSKIKWLGVSIRMVMCTDVHTIYKTFKYMENYNFQQPNPLFLGVQILQLLCTVIHGEVKNYNHVTIIIHITTEGTE